MDVGSFGYALAPPSPNTKVVEPPIVALCISPII
jgi:hypothetical protein